MKIPQFEMERMQSTWENVVEMDMSESGIRPVTLRELSECLGHGGPAGCHQLGKRGVGERDRHVDPVVAHPAPAVGQLPEEHVQAHVDPRLVQDGHRHRHAT